MRSSDELELKYSATDLSPLEAFLDEHFPVAPTEPGWREYRTADRFFDTSDGSLLRAGYGARLRRTGGQTTLGLKSDVDVTAGLHHRRELEAPATPSLDPADWPPSEPRGIVRRLARGRRLHERFVLRQVRRERAWRAETGACLLSLDLVSVRHGRDEVGQLRGLEVELLEGQAQLLRRIDQQIMASGLVAHEPRSKMAQAGEMVRAAAPLTPDEPFAEAGRRVLHGHLRRMLEREAATRAGDPLALKQMRVATRRMRATWRLFDGAYESDAARRYVRELRRVARRLGRVRDLDVLLEGLPVDEEMTPLADTWRERRENHWEALLSMLDSDDYRTFVEDYRRFTETPGESLAAEPAARVRDAAGSRVWAAYERLRAYEPALEQPEVATLHALRIDGKRLRYAIETFAPVMPRRRTADLLARLRRLQDHLGSLNDADVAAQRAREWLAGRRRRPAARAAVGAYASQREGEVERLRAGFERVWRPVGGRPFAGALGEALVELAFRGQS